MDLFFNIFFPIFLVFFACLSIKLLIIILMHYKIFDIPNKRSNHIYPTPKGAGLILTLYICGSIFFYMTQGIIQINLFKEITILMLVLSIFSFIDDLYSISFLKKLLFQILIISLGTYLLNSKINLFCSSTYNSLSWIMNYEFYKNFIRIIIFVFWMWILNLFNFMDGIDGLTASQVLTFNIGLICLSTLGQINENFSHVGIIVFAIYLGFLYYNKPPAKIFLGDSGSISIGFFIGGIIIITFLEHKNFISLFILILYYLFDTTLTLLRRFVDKQNIFSAHSQHFYQKKVRNGFSHALVLNKIIFINILLIIPSLNYFNSPFFCIIVSVLMVIYLLIWLGSQKKNTNANK